jgi:hypothetical protein
VSALSTLFLCHALSCSLVFSLPFEISLSSLFHVQCIIFDLEFIYSYTQ